MISSLHRPCIALAISLLWLVGCTTNPADSSSAQTCQTQLAALQDAVARHSVQDAQYAPVDGFATYRTSRFWSSFNGTKLNQEQERAWRQQLHNLGMTSLAIEWRALPPTAKEPLTPFNDFRRQCDAELFQASLHQPLPPTAVTVADSYSSWQRFFGLYALIKYGAAGSIEEYQQDMRQRIEAVTTPTEPLLRLTPPANPGSITQPIPAADWLHAAYQSHPLSVPILPAAQRQQLIQAHAPVFAIAQQSLADRPGAAQWNPTGQQRRINTDLPTVYSDSSYIRYGDRILLQLNYTLWFPERPKPTPNDWYGGELDGLVWRVTLQENGTVLFYDSIHPCGCYHSVHIPMDSPLQQQLTHIANQDTLEPIMAFSTHLKADEHPASLMVEAATHYLVHVDKPSADSGQRYQLQDYDQLRSLPAGDNVKNWFDSDGLIASSSRRERYFLWPLGVPNAGAMRQRGHHAIAFVGKRHFDEASVEQLLELGAGIIPGTEKQPSAAD